MGAAGPLWWLWAWAVWMGFNLVLMVVYPTVHRAAVQQVRAAGGRGAEGARHGADAALRLRRQGPVRDGRQPPQRPCQRLLHRLRRGQARGVLRHAAVAAVARRGGGGAGARAGPLQAPAHGQAHRDPVRASAWSASALLGWLSRQPWFYTGLGVAPNLEGPNDALALLLFMLAVPLFTFFISPLLAQLSRRHEFEADAYAVSQTSGARPAQRAAEAVRGQRLDADARPAVRAVLLLAPAGVRAAGADGRAGGAP